MHQLQYMVHIFTVLNIIKLHCFVVTFCFVTPSQYAPLLRKGE